MRVLAKSLAVIAGQDDNGVVEQAALLQVLVDALDLLVEVAQVVAVSVLRPGGWVTCVVGP